VAIHGLESTAVYLQARVVCNARKLLPELFEQQLLLF
jgi:hypothetical protein